VLDTHSPLVCVSIAPLYGLRYSPAFLPTSAIRHSGQPPTVQVGHYGRPTVTVQIKKGDEWKAAFKTKFGHWEPLVMFFGLTNSPSTFQEMMNVIYKEVIEKHAARGTIIRIYMDDIAVATTGTLQDHIDAVRDVLRVAEQHDLYFKPSKCTFHASSIDYLGVIIEKGMTRMDPVKIAGIKNWPTPVKVKDVCSFLGFCNFYRPFIQGFAHLARPLNELMCKDTEWTWEK
jgi:hypothetical protein